MCREDQDLTGLGGLVRRARRGALQAAGVALAALVLTPAGASAATPSTPYAMHSMLQLNSPYPFKQAMFADAAAAGASEIRVDISLGALSNPYISGQMWQDVGDYIQLSQQYGIRVLVDLNASNNPQWETCQPGADPSQGLCGVTDLAAYGAEITALVQHTRGVIDDFEIVNEPDGSWAFSGTPQQYAAMLATAYAAVHANDPAGRVLLGGIMAPQDGGWLAAVFQTPGYNAAHAFDIANVHLRDTLSRLPADMASWRAFFASYGDGGVPLWVTETGYPSDPAYQYDPAFRGTDAASGQAEQAAFLARSLPALVSAGAAKVFVTERDNLGGQFASEGLIGGQVNDNQETAFDAVPKPAYAAFQQLVRQALAPAPALPATARAAKATPKPKAHKRVVRHRKPRKRRVTRRRRRARRR